MNARLLTLWSRVVLTLGAIVLALTAAAVPAFAQEDPLEALSDEDFDRVVELLERAREAEEDEQWRVALGYFEQVSGIVALPEVRIREARANAALGDIPEAAAIYEALVTTGGEVGDEAAAELRALADAHPPSLLLGIAGTEARVRIDGGRARSYGVGEHEIALTPGDHVIDVEAEDNSPVRLEVSVGIGETAERYVTFVASTPVVVTEPPPRDDDASGGNARIAVPISLTVLSLGAFGAGGALAADASNQADAYESARAQAISNASQTTSNQQAVLQLQSARDDAFARANVANGLFAGGAALAVGAAVTWWWALKDRGDRDADLAVSPTLGGGSVQVRW